ncbi:MAG: hypothetical protein R3F65_23190 [bacterium]|nr:hypothetical protein [Myxococcales bacterium]MCB9552240.1 hypothetical protein [Myxococcales bacterium]
MTSALSSFYKNRPIILWVEDPLTRTWLRSIWRDADISLLVAGGTNAVQAAVKDAREAGHANVFGLSDRDFRDANQDRWLARDKNPPVFIPEAFEIENFLLDFDGLAALGPAFNPHRRSAAELEARAHALASQSAWWMAARATIADVRTLLLDDFPEHPPLARSPTLTCLEDTCAELVARLIESPWGARLRHWPAAIDVNWFAEKLGAHHQALTAQLGSGEWRWTWSGKELFGPIASFLGDFKRAQWPDLAMGLAAHQRATGTVDPALAELRTALRCRAGLDPWPPMRTRGGARVPT